MLQKIWFVLSLMIIAVSMANAASKNPALIAKLQAQAQGCYPDSRYEVVDNNLVPKPQAQPPQKVPACPVYVAAPPQVYLGFGYTYWGGHHGGHYGSCHGGSHHHGGHR